MYSAGHCVQFYSFRFSCFLWQTFVSKALKGKPLGNDLFTVKSQFGEGSKNRFVHPRGATYKNPGIGPFFKQRQQTPGIHSLGATLVTGISGHEIMDLEFLNALPESRELFAQKKILFFLNTPHQKDGRSMFCSGQGFKHGQERSNTYSSGYEYQGTRKHFLALEKKRENPKRAIHENPIGWAKL
jgi:hypothetical protein